MYRTKPQKRVSSQSATRASKPATSRSNKNSTLQLLSRNISFPSNNLPMSNITHHRRVISDTSSSQRNHITATATRRAFSQTPEHVQLPSILLSTSIDQKRLHSFANEDIPNEHVALSGIRTHQHAPHQPQLRMQRIEQQNAHLKLKPQHGARHQQHSVRDRPSIRAQIASTPQTTPHGNSPSRSITTSSLPRLRKTLHGGTHSLQSPYSISDQQLAESDVLSSHTQHRMFHKTPTALKSGRAAQKAAGGLDRAALSRGEHLEQLTLMQTLGKLAPYIWPKGNNANKMRVVASLVCLFSSKILNVATPVLFKEAINSLTERVPVLEKYSKVAGDAIDDTKTAITTATQTASDTVTKASAQVAAEFNKATQKLGETVDKSIQPIKDKAVDPAKDFTQSLLSDFFKVLTEPEFLNISTTAVPFAILIAYGLVRVVSSLTNELKSAIFTKVTTDALRVIAADLLRHLLHMDLAFHLERNTGAISLAIDRGNKSLGMVLNMITFRIIPTVFEIALVLGVLSTQCGNEYTAVALATLVSYIWYTIAITNWRMKFRQDMNRHANQASSIAFESLMNVDTVQRFNNQEVECEKYAKVFEGHGKATIRTESSLSLLNWGQFSIFSIGMTAVMLLAAKGVMEGTMTVGDLVMVNALLFQLSIPLNIVGTVYRELKQAVLDMQTMFALRSTKSLITNAPDAVNLTKHHQQIQSDALNAYLEEHQVATPPPDWTPPGLGLKLRDVTFSYSNDTKQVIDGISLDIEPGSSVAFVGGSGCGKSTLLKLTSRQHDTTSGTIEIGGIPIKNIELASLRQNIGIVPQETTLFNDTILYNIRYAKPTATDEEVFEAARLANIDHSIRNMMNGYNTIVGERGLKLSGGEKQRVSIARMMLVNPPIVFCDEATSALDSATEYEIMHNLRTITKNKTCLYVAHRLSTITHCDKIVVIDKGKVIEQGSHQELLQVDNGDGVYARMWKYQSTVGNLNVPAIKLSGKSHPNTDDDPNSGEQQNHLGEPIAPAKI